MIPLLPTVTAAADCLLAHHPDYLIDRSRAHMFTVLVPVTPALTIILKRTFRLRIIIPEIYDSDLFRHTGAAPLVQYD
jgi:hypothetical protein